MVGQIRHAMRDNCHGEGRIDRCGEVVVMRCVVHVPTTLDRATAWKVLSTFRIVCVITTTLKDRRAIWRKKER